MPSGTRDKTKISGTVPEIPGQLEPMLFVNRVIAPSGSVPALLRRFNYFQLESCRVACAFACHSRAIPHVSGRVVL